MRNEDPVEAILSKDDASNEILMPVSSLGGRQSSGGRLPDEGRLGTEVGPSGLAKRF